MSGFYDCWDLGGLDTTLNSYLASVRTAKTVPAANLEPPKPPDTFAGTTAAVVPAPQMQNPAPESGYRQSEPDWHYRPQPQYAKIPDMTSLYSFLPILLSPTVCLFLWMLLVATIVILAITRRSKPNKYAKKYNAAKRHMRKYDRV